MEKWTAENGQWKLQTKSGQLIDVNAAGMWDPIPVEGAWDVTFPLLTSEVKQVKLNTGSWTDQNDEDVKYFSGTTTYIKSVSLTKEQLTGGKRLFLDMGVIWKPPYKVEITQVVVPGANTIEVKVTNTWFNRLTRDAGLPDDEKRTWIAGGGFGRDMRTDAPLMLSGLIGPVTIHTVIKV